MSDQSGFQIGADAPTQYQEYVERFMLPFVDALVAATVKRGDAVLDVACGTGFVTRAASRVVGSTGRVAGVDINPGMIAAARALPVESDRPITWHEGSALELPFEDDEFDAVTCQQGLQFFPDQAAALAEMRRVSRSNALVGATVWAPHERSPYLAAQLDVLSRYCDLDLPRGQRLDVDGGDSTIGEWFRVAGLADVEVRELEFLVEIPSLAEYIQSHMAALPWGSDWFALDDTTRAQATAEFVAALAQWHTPDGGAQVPFTSFLALGAVRP